MAEYVKRDDALCALEQINPVDYGAMWDYEAHHYAGECLRDCKEAIDSIPAADVAPVVHGRWISFLGGDHIMPERYYRCSRCGRVESRRQPYCHCGAKMDGGADHEAD
jgi:hypothetical protein